MLITPLYASILGLILVALSVRTLTLRRQLKVAIGYGEEPTLERAMRVHANFCEYVPISLLLLFFLEGLTDSQWWIHVLGTALVLGRSIHAFGVSRIDENFVFRVTGMALTFTVIISASGRILLSYL